MPGEKKFHGIDGLWGCVSSEKVAAMGLKEEAAPAKRGMLSVW